MNKINFLPPWVETNLQPAFYDLESGTCLQQTSRMYAKVNQLIRSVNEQNETIADYVQQFLDLKDYVEDYFDNLDVQQEINNKLDKMSQDGTLGALLAVQLAGIQADFNAELDRFEDQTNTAISDLSARVDGAVSGAPIPVSSTSQMTDHSKIYLLTTDGYWYYWNGSAWTQGNEYQSVAIADSSVTPQKTTFAKRTSNLIDVRNANILTAYLNQETYKIQSSSSTRTVYIPCEPNTVYMITRSLASGRFAAATTIDTPANDVSFTQYQNASSGTYITLTTNATAQYLCVFYYHSSHSTNSSEEALNDLCIIASSVNQGVIPSYVVEAKTINYNDSSVTPIKTSFHKTSSNIFDYTAVPVENIFPNGNTNELDASNAVRSAYIPCEPNTNYVVHRLAGKRFAVYTTADTPSVGDSIIDLVVKNTASEIKITTSSTANYLGIYFYNANQDTATINQILQSICVVKGSDSIESYIPYGSIIEVFTDNINDGAVTSSKLSPSIKNSILSLGEYNSRNGIYGVEYDITATSSACTRIADAEGLNNDYIVDDEYQLHGGSNDFDHIFPWCCIKRCNVRISDNGDKSIVYEGDESFALDGSNGDVMVEIPKFYSMRKREGNREIVAITGEPKSGFNVEPAFTDGEKELDYIYVACYPTAVSDGISLSRSGAYPDCYHTLAENITTLGTNNLQSYDFTTFLMLQKLMMIEFANRGLTQYLGGMCRLPYLAPNSINVIDGFGENYFTFQEGVGQGILDALWVGERIKIGDAEHENSMAHVRVITDITKIGTQYTVTYDGEDLSDELSVGDGIGCFGQISGMCDSLTYHTGRVSKATDSGISKYVSPMRYRYIENIIGNTWDMLAGLRLKNLKVYYSNIPNFIESTSDERWKNISYNLPLNSNYPSANDGWIKSEGYDYNNPLINLPKTVGSGGGENKYYGGTFYSNDGSDVEYLGVYGGGWDTYYWANPNTLRINLVDSSKSQLYGSRAIYRG